MRLDGGTWAAELRPGWPLMMCAKPATRKPEVLRIEAADESASARAAVKDRRAGGLRALAQGPHRASCKRVCSPGHARAEPGARAPPRCFPTATPSVTPGQHRRRGKDPLKSVMTLLPAKPRSKRCFPDYALSQPQRCPAAHIADPDA